MNVREEFLWLVPMKDKTTPCHIFRSLVTALDTAGVDLSSAVRLAVDWASSMVGRNAGFATKFREKVQAKNGGQGFLIFHCILN